MNEGKFDWTQENINPNLKQVPIVFPEDVVSTLLSSNESTLLAKKTLDISSRRDFLNRFITDLLLNSAAGREVFELQYGFSTVVKEKAVTPSDFDLWKGNPYFDTLVNSYQQERLILIKAMEQALTLIASNPVLRNLISIGLKARYEARDIEQTEIDRLQEQVIKQGLNIVKMPNQSGFKGVPDNHGTLQLDNSGVITLYLDKVGISSLGELIHEFSAYLLLKAVPNLEFKTHQDLRRAKNTFLKYTILCIDLIKNMPTVTSRYTNMK